MSITVTTMKEIYQKPEICSIALKASGFFAAAQEYDPDEVAKALAAAGVLGSGNSEKLGIEIIDLES